MAEAIASAVLDTILQRFFACCTLGDVQKDVAEFGSELAAVGESVELAVNIAKRNGEEINIDLQMWLETVRKFLQDMQQLGEDLSRTRKLPRSLNFLERFRLRRLVEENLYMARRLMLSVDYSGRRLINQELCPVPSFSDVQAASGKEGLQNYESAYKNLPQATQSLLLLCPLFPKNHKISIGELTRFAVGLQMLEGSGSLETARKRIREMAMELKGSDLLSYAGEEQFVMIPDAVFDFVHRMASEGGNVYLKPGLGLTVWPEGEALQRCTSISLMNNNIKNLVPASGFECPGLKCLLLAGNDLMNVSGTSFQKLESLKLLTVGGNIISVEGFHSLTSLRALHMEKCKLNDSIQKLGHLKQLEILSFSGSDIQELPNELGYLENLKLLDLSDCKQLQRVPANLIPKWSKLEELYIGNFREWSKEEEVDEFNNAMASVAELLQLSHLDILSLTAYSTCFPRDFVFRKLRRYQIVVHEDDVCDDDHPIPATSAAISISSFWLDPLRELFHNVEYLYLKDIKGLQNLFPKLDKGGLTALKLIEIQDCEDLECLVDATGLEADASFSNLQHLELKNLPELKYIWKGLNPHVSLDLQHLENLKLQNCNNLKQIFEVNEASNNISSNAPTMRVCLQTLTTLEISHCHSIVSNFRVANGLPELKSLEVSDCTELEEIVVHGDEVCDNHHQIPTSSAAISISSFWLDPLGELFHNVKYLHLKDIKGLQILFPRLDKGGLTALKLIEIQDCEDFECLVDATGLEVATSFSNLQHLELKNLPKLKCIWKGLSPHVSLDLQHLEILKLQDCNNLKQIFEVNEASDNISSNAPPMPVCLQRLTTLEISNCHSIVSTFRAGVANGLPQLKSLEVSDCKELKEIFGWEDTCVKLPQLQRIALKNLINLSRICLASTFVMPILQTLYVERCPNLGPSDVEVRSTKDEKIPAAHLEELYLIGKLRGEANKRGGSSIGSSAPFRFPVGYLYTNLKYLVLYGLPLLELWKDPTQIVSLQNLMYLQVNNCTKLRCIFTVTISQNLSQLMYLEIYGCDELKQIIEKDDMLSSEAQRLCFPKLADFRVADCPKLTSLFPINIARLVGLKRISVRRAKELTHVFQGKPVDGKSEKEIELPQLEEVILEDLPRLIAFSPEGYDFILPSLIPSLKPPEVNGCWMMATRLEELNGVWHARTLVNATSLYPQQQRSYLPLVPNSTPQWQYPRQVQTYRVGRKVKTLAKKKRHRTKSRSPERGEGSSLAPVSTYGPQASLEEDRGSLQPPHPAHNFIPYSLVPSQYLDLGPTYNYKPYQPPATYLYGDPNNPNACVIC